MRSAACVVSLALLLGLYPGSGLASEEEGGGFNLSEQRHLLEIGLFLGAYFPPKAHELFDPDVRWQPIKEVSFIGGLRLGYLPLPFFGLELEGAVMPTSLREVDESAIIYTVRGHVIGQLPWGKVAPFLVVGYGLQGITSDSTDGLGSDIDGAFHAGLGAKWYVMKQLVVRLDGRVNVGGETNPGGLRPQFELLAGASYVIGRKEKEPPPPPPDRDGDGVIDAEDKCPDKPGEKPDGCPPDKDGDGVYDKEDKCPDLAGDKPGGCPPDKDGDSVYDKEDKCPETPGEYPTGCPPDRDGDKVFDKDDRCPDKPGVWPDGCPPDKDGDGIADTEDKCPDKPETKNGFRDRDGCPDKLPRKLKRFTGAIKGIYFASGKATIRKRSHRVLNGAVKILKKYKDTRIRIEGHTDDVGKDDANMKLSEARAKAVMDYFVGKGIDGKRLQSVGKGETEPVAKGTSRRARAKNRRIEFQLLMGDEK